jgi:histone deacetylase complex regulatory component SIN3
VLADSRSQELFELLKRDRALQVPTIQDQLNSRRFAENLLGPDENIFRIDWVRSFLLQILSIQFNLCVVGIGTAPRHENHDYSTTRERRFEDR